MAVQDALSPLAPPPPSAEPVVDATVVPEKDPRRQKFDELKSLADTDPRKYQALMALVEEFIIAGHNPRNPTDVMFEILGITPEFLEGLLFSLKQQSSGITLAAQETAARTAQPSPAAEVEKAAEAAPAPLPETE